MVETVPSRRPVRLYARARDVPGPLVALLACSLLLGLVWAFVTPPFQAPDENSHFGYVQSIADGGSLPGDPARSLFSTEQIEGGSASNSDQAAAVLQTKIEWDARAFDEWLAHDRQLGAAGRKDGGGPNPAAANPPLYYLLEVPAYEVTSGGNLFARLLALRLWSMLWLAVTVAFAWLLCGEALGRDRQLQLAATGLVALAPMMTFLSATVSPDAMLFAVWTAALWIGVRILRRGVTPAWAAALLGCVGLAIVVKAASYALLPGAGFVLAVALRRSRMRFGPALRIAAAAGAGLLLTAGTWYVAARLLSRPAAAQVSSATGVSGVNVRELLSYVWQFYLPRMPGMTDFPSTANTLPVYDIWLKGTWATFGWTEVLFRNRVYAVLAIATVVVIVLAASELWRARRSADWAIGAFLALVTVSLVAGLHWSEYGLIKAGAANFNQGRYLLPLAGVAGIVVALALRRLGPRLRMPGAGAVLGGLMVLQLFSLGLVLTRFYA